MADFHYQGFTQRAKKLIHIAHNLGITLGVRRMGDEFLLLALLKMGEGLAFDTLRKLGVAPDKLAAEIDRQIREKQQPNEAALLETPEFGPTAQRRLQNCAQLALSLGHDYVGTEHILLVLLRGGGTTSAQLLKPYDVDYEKVREAVQAFFQGVAGKAEGGERDEEEAGEEPAEERPAPRGKPPVNAKSLVARFSRDLTKLARDGKLDPVIGREKEIARLEQILSRRTKNNPVLIGDPGVGKTAIVEGLAQRIVAEEVPQVLRGKRLLTLDLAGIVAGTKYRGEFEQRLKSILSELIAARDAIVFLDELHTIIGAGSAEGSMDAANLLKPSLARGELQCIGATTLDEYKKYIEKDAALERRFQPVQVPEPTVEETVAILRGLRPRYEEHHRVAVDDEALVAAARLSKRYISDRFLPDKAVDLMDEACARLQLSIRRGPSEKDKLEARLKELETEKHAAVAAQDFERAAELRDEEQLLQKQVAEAPGAESAPADAPRVTAGDIARLIAQWTGIPVDSITETEGSKLLRIEEELRKHVIGQEEAISAIARAIRRARTGLKDPAKPAGTFLFLGPTGVGKTELARALAMFLFGDESALIRIDMSEFMEKFSVSRLTGAPPGYVGYEEGGQLTEKVRRRPFAVVLLDEIEKAHPDVFNILLQVLDDGQLCDNLGHTVDFKNTVIIMTSNVGGRDIAKGGGGLGFIGDSAHASYEKLKDRALSELKKTFNPEFLNRLDEMIVFRPLTRVDLRAILDIMLREVIERVAVQDLRLELTDAAKDLLVEKGFDEKYGARPLLRVIRREIEEPLSLKLLENTFTPGAVIVADAAPDGSALVFTAKP